MSARRSGGFQPRCEELEVREMPSWGATPPTSLVVAPQDDRWTITSRDQRGNYSDIDSITRNEVNYYDFVAQRTGWHVFEAGKYGSTVDTVAALYDANGRLINYNDDDGYSRDSRFGANLVAGRTYVFGVTNYNGTPNGAYRVAITAPGLYERRATDYGSTYVSDGWARLSGTTLTVELYGLNRSSWYYRSHSIEVRILDVNGQPIHSGQWRLSFQTSGSLVWGGPPGSHTMTRSYDLSGWDLSRASSLWVRVSHY